MHLVANAIIVM